MGRGSQSLRALFLFFSLLLFVCRSKKQNLSLCSKHFLVVLCVLGFLTARKLGRKRKKKKKNVFVTLVPISSRSKSCSVRLAHLESLFRRQHAVIRTALLRRHQSSHLFLRRQTEIILQYPPVTVNTCINKHHQAEYGHISYYPMKWSTTPY